MLLRFSLKSECTVSRGETIEEACEVHGTDADALVEKLNKFFAQA